MVLENEADVVVPPCRQLTLGQRVDAATVEPDFTRRRLIDAAEHVEQRRLA